MKLPDGLAGLERLPWFGTRDGRLVVTAELGPIVDVHAHLAMGFVRRLRVDLSRRTRAVRHYLPTDAPHDLDRYANEDLSPDQIASMTRDLTWRSLTSRGWRATHTGPNLLAEMDDLGIRHSVLLPIDMPGLSDNARAYADVAARHPRLIAFGSVHPYSRGPEARLAAQVHGGIRGLKLHPGMQLFRPDGRRAMRLYGPCGDAEIPVLWHCGPVGIEPALGRRMCALGHYEAPIRQFPGTTFILGHSGALDWEAGLALAKRYRNVVLDLSCQGLPAVRRILDEADPERVVFGSDWPFYAQALPLAKVLIATEGREALRAKVLWGNARRLLDLDPPT